MTQPDLFSGGFAWGNEPVASVATAFAPDGATARSSDFRASHASLHGPIAAIATVAESLATPDVTALSQNPIARVATAAATGNNVDLCASQPVFPPPVATVATVANWLEGIERMRRAENPPMLAHGRWKTVVQDAVAFVQLWGADAIDAGWSTLDAFGTNPEPQQRRVDRLGLVVLLDGRPIRSLDADSAAIAGRPNTTKFWRSLRTGGAVALWDLLPTRSGSAEGVGVGKRAYALPLTTLPCQRHSENAREQKRENQ
ncbi:hypothetical protein ACVWYO_000467 [Sphingomonas sp. UYP23]